jgi:hypothetical protein
MMFTNTAESASVPVLFTVKVIAEAAASTEVKQVIKPTSPFAVTAVVVLVPCVTFTSMALALFFLLLIWLLVYCCSALGPGVSHACPHRFNLLFGPRSFNALYTRFRRFPWRWDWLRI